MTKIQLHNIFIKNKITNTILIQDFNLEISSQEIYALTGPSGCGKSSLLAYLCGFLDKTVFESSGEVNINQQNILDLPTHQRRISLMLQDDLLFPHMNVLSNLMFALSSEIKKKDRISKCRETLAEVDMDEFYLRMPHELSGGQRARISVLRALLSDPQFLLLDEPFNKLDSELRENFRNFLYKETKKRDLPVLLVTHDIQDAPQKNNILSMTKSYIQSNEQ